MNCRLVVQVFCHQECKKESYSEMGRRAKTWSSQDPHPLCGNPPVGGISQLRRDPLRSEGSETYVRLHSQEHLEREEDPPYIFDFKNQQCLHPGEPRAVGKQDSSLRGISPKLTNSKHSHNYDILSSGYFHAFEHMHPCIFFAFWCFRIAVYVW